MELAVLGTESLGVRGLCCLVRAGGRCILVDPGVAPGYTRNGLLPHSVQWMVIMCCFHAFFAVAMITIRNITITKAET